MGRIGGYPKITVQDVERHRNGVCGEPFSVVLFTDAAEGRMVGIVFEREGQCAILQVDKLAAGNVTFGENSWRGDVYEPALRLAIKEAES